MNRTPRPLSDQEMDYVIASGKSPAAYANERLRLGKRVAQVHHTDSLPPLSVRLAALTGQSLTRPTLTRQLTDAVR